MLSYDAINTLDKLDVTGKNVLIRLDLNIPIVDQKIESLFRLQQVAQTLQYLLERKANIRIISHLGRPVNNQYDAKYSLKILQEPLADLLNHKVTFMPELKHSNEKVCLYENLRFNRGEEENELNFCKQLKALGEIFVQDAFACLHRKHASTYGIVDLFPKENVGIGFLVKNEISRIAELFDAKNEVITIIGGSKLETKLDLLYKIAKLSQVVLVGGKMANTLLYANGLSAIQDIEVAFVDQAKDFLRSNDNIVLPIDAIVEDGSCLKVENITHQKMFDVGVETLSLYQDILHKYQNSYILWNGPIGWFENKNYQYGTQYISNYLSNSKNKVFVGGGDTISAVEKFSKLENFYFASTGGGAFLDYFQNGVLIGLNAFMKPFLTSEA